MNLLLLVKHKGEEPQFYSYISDLSHYANIIKNNNSTKEIEQSSKNEIYPAEDSSLSINR